MPAGSQAVAAFLAQVGTAVAAGCRVPLTGYGSVAQYAAWRSQLVPCRRVRDMDRLRPLSTMVRQTRAPRRLFYQRLFALTRLVLSFSCSAFASVVMFRCQSLSVQFCPSGTRYFALWIGALYPLLMISRTEQVAELRQFRGFQSMPL